MVSLIYVSLVNLIAYSHQRPLLNPDKIQRFIDEINSKNNFNEDIRTEDLNKYNYNVIKDQLKDASLQSNVFYKNEETGANGLDELLNMIDKQLTLKGRGEKHHRNTLVSKINQRKNNKTNVKEDIEDVDVLLVDLTNLRKNRNNNVETNTRNSLRKLWNPRRFRWGNYGSTSTVKPQDGSMDTSIELPGHRPSATRKPKSTEKPTEKTEEKDKSKEIQTTKPTEKSEDNLKEIPEDKSKEAQKLESKEKPEDNSEEIYTTKPTMKSEDKSKEISGGDYKTTRKPRMTRKPTTTRKPRIRVKTTRKPTRKSRHTFKTKSTPRGRRTTTKRKKEKKKPESSLHDTLILVPETGARNYRKISEGLARSVLKYINGQEELDKHNLRPNQLKRIQQLKTDSIYHSMTESEIITEITKIFFGDDSNTKIYPHKGKDDVIYVPRWIFTFLFATNPKSLRDNSKKPRNILPLTQKQKNRKKKLVRLDKYKTVKRKWGKYLQDGVWNYGVPFELKIQGLGQAI